MPNVALFKQDVTKTVKSHLMTKSSESNLMKVLFMMQS